jgi:hypothetical protein
MTLPSSPFFPAEGTSFNENKDMVMDFSPQVKETFHKEPPAERALQEKVSPEHPR